MIVMDLTILWYDTLELPLNALTIVASVIAVFYWVKLFRRMNLSGRQDTGWLWVFASVLMTLLLNVSALILLLGNGRVPYGIEKVMVVDIATMDFLTTISRALMAITLGVGAYMLFASVKTSGEFKFVYSPVKPQAETPSDSAPKYDLKPGVSYLVKEGQPPSMREYYMRADRHIVTGMELFSDLVTHGVLGFCATRRFPPKVRGETNLMKTPMVWLTQEKGFNEAVHPGDLTELSHIMKDFMQKGGDTVVLLEGLEYLILHNNFEEMLRFVQGLDDVVVQNRARLIVTIDPSALSEQEFHMLSRELTEFSPAKP